MIKDPRQLIQHVLLEMEKMTIVILATLSFLYSNALTFFSGVCSILNRRILKGADSADPCACCQALGIEETVGYN